MPGTGESADCVHELFEQQATRRPDHTALVSGRERLSYRELDARADLLAGRLVEAGVRTGSVVGVHLPRGVDLVVGVLATLKAGGAYLVLDPDLPTGRLRTMASDAAVTAVIAADADDGSRLSVPAPTLVAGATGAPAAPTRAAVGSRPGDTACVMFTSGSTGRPKGVLSPHRAIVGTLVGQDYLPLRPGTVWLQCAPVSWDAFALELWGALLFGGTCVLQPGQRPDPVVMARLVAEHHVDAMYLSASLFNVVVDEYPAALDGVGHLVVGGEALSPAHLRRARRRFPGLRVRNGYGPVECMIFVTTHLVSAADTAASSVPIGHPLPGKDVRVLDARLRPVGDGQVGELYATGVGTAHGYLGSPALTAQRFVADPLGPPGSRMYRTGDLARWHDSAPLEFLGRADAQVKIRGFRVEPGEVEAVLSGHPGVRQAAVRAASDTHDGGRLVAYVVPTAGHPAPSREALREHVASLLPDFMVPDTVVAVDGLPRTATGKLDRAALEDLSEPASEERRSLRPARTADERTLATIFAEVLGSSRVGLDDDFFDLGGNSLLVARLLARVQAAFGVEIGVRAVFEAPTVAGLARHLPGPVTPSPASASTPEQLPLSPAQRRLWFLDQVDAGVAYSMPILFRLRGSVDVAALRRALADVVGRHEALRTVFTADRGEPVQRILHGDQLRPELRTVTVATGRREAAILAEARRPFDLGGELPIRLTLFTDAEDRHSQALLVAMHHIAVDGWSLPPLMRDLSRAYIAHRDGVSGVFPAPGPSYRERSARQQRRLGDPAEPDSLSARQLTFWRDTLRGLPDGTALPRRTDRPGQPGPHAATVVRHLDADAHARLTALARRHGATLFMVLHSALGVVLARAGAGADIAIGAPVAGRAGADVEEVVGFFVNMLVLRTDLSGDPTVEDLLARVRETDLAAFAHQDLPFDQVVDEVNPLRAPGRHPLVDVVLALQNNARAELTLPGADARLEVVRTGAARFELLVDVTDEYEPGGTPAGIAVTVEYQADAFRQPVMEWVAEALLAVLAAMAVDPRVRVAALPGVPDPPRDMERAAAPRWHAPVPADPVARPAPPSNDLEARIAALWADVLGVAHLGVHDNFFALGGNSLTAVRVAARIATNEGLAATAAQLFSTPTVAGLAAALRRDTVAAPAPIPRRPRVPRRAPTPGEGAACN